MPSFTDKLKEKVEDAKQKAQKLRDQTSAKAKLLKLRADVTSIIAKTKPLLLKEQLKCKDRAKKVLDLKKQAEKLNDDKVVKLAASMQKHAAGYQKAVEGQLKLIKDVSILNSPPADLQAFIANLAAGGKAATDVFDKYRDRKQKLRVHLKKDDKDWPDKLCAFFESEKPTWKSVQKSLAAVADSAGDLLRGAKEALDLGALLKF